MSETLECTPERVFMNDKCGYKCGKCCKGCCTMKYECCAKVGDCSKCGCSTYTCCEAGAQISAIGGSATFMAAACVLCCGKCNGPASGYHCMCGAWPCWQGTFIAAAGLLAIAAGLGIGVCAIKYYCHPKCGTNAEKCGCTNFSKGYED